MHRHLTTLGFSKKNIDAMQIHGDGFLYPNWK